MKLVNESIEDVLKPKTKEKILADIGGRDDATFKKSRKPINGTYGIGEVNISYDNLVKLFGEPQEKYGDFDDYDKVSTRWVVEDENGRVYTIYDWKATYDMLPSQFRSLSSYEWHIGGIQTKEEEERERAKPLIFMLKKDGAEDLVRYIYKNI